MSKFFLGGKRMRMCRKTTNSLVCKKKTFTRKDDEEEYQPKEKKKTQVPFCCVGLKHHESPLCELAHTTAPR